ncbi:hypothetical protein [Azospirillum sp. ST 5-10]|uniref:hypothetical protein n=1 Tax=unclassified Azospirillum TaxID=2630922 RepID=UPI003F4A3599
MSVFLGFCGHRVFVEHARWATPAGRFDLRRENGEYVVWLGRLNIIYTPARWVPPPPITACPRRAAGAADGDPRPP